MTSDQFVLDSMSNSMIEFYHEIRLDITLLHSTSFYLRNSRQLIMKLHNFWEKISLNHYNQNLAQLFLQFSSNLNRKAAQYVRVVFYLTHLHDAITRGKFYKARFPLQPYHSET